MATSSGANLDAAAARCDLNGNATTTTTTTKTSSTSPRKEKTILGWLVKSASANDKSNVNDNDNDRHNDNNNRGNNNNSCHCETRAFRDFRGVQTLRLLWSKRISSASEEAAAAHPQQRGQVQGLGTLRKLNKSVSCLVNAFNNARDWPSLTNAHETRAKRAASLHNLQEPPPLTSPQLQRDKDNFYKYKNAEQAKMQNKLRRGSDATANASATFPAVKAGGAPGERLQWPKREDIVSKCKTERERSLSDNEHDCEREREREREQVNLISAGREQAAAAAAGTSAIRISLSATSFDGGSCESLQTVNSINSNTTTSTAATVTSRATGTRRKYSFKTHAGKSFHQHHTPRRMSSHSHSHSHSQAAESGHASASGSASGVVRQLTQQFNEIIQKDARLLEQVKRKNGVWLARGAHVYKIVEKPAVQQVQSEQVQSEHSEQSVRSSMVQRNIKKFEKLEKPAVPLKPQQLLRKHQEQMNQRPSTLSLSKQMRSKRARSQQQQREQREQKEQELAVVREELPKTPVELHASTDEGVQSDVDVDDATKPKHADSALTQTLPADDELDDADSAAAAEERQKQRKHKYATIYEKLRFLPFAKGGKKSATPSPIKTTAAATSEQKDPEQEPEPLPSPCVEADAKILAALEVLDQKLKILAEPPAKTADGELLLAANDDFEQRLLPNSSFIYQASNKQISNNQLLLNQAVNVTLVNAIEGEQMIMEQKQLAAEEGQQQQLEQQSRRQLQAEPEEEEPMYEPITPTMETKTEPQASSLFKLTSQMLKEPDALQLPVEDIYQTVEEATAAPATTTPATPTANGNWLEGYESIAGSTRNSNSDDYEAFATPTTTPTTTTTLSTGTLGRNTRDELPELPKPKRVLPKSPLIMRPAPAKPAQPSRLAGKPCAGPASTDEDDENIYDTIKGCTDAISLSSNCYESISNYRKSKNSAAIGAVEGVAAGGGVVAGATASGVQLSSSGSTLTLASDHRTNSLYESSLAAGVLYGSASVGCRSSLASSGAGSAGSSGSGGVGGGAGKQCDKRSSIAGSSDNSDAWVDISDGEATPATAAVTSEAQFVV